MIFPFLTIKDFFVRESDIGSEFVVDGIYEEIAKLSEEDRGYYQQDREKHLKTAMPGWTLHRLNFKPDGTVKITYRKKATT
jgi:hypothetical protein